MRVYLSGPIKNVSKESASSWRKHVRDRLAEYGIGCFDPVENQPEEVVSIIAHDLDAISNCQAVLAYAPQNVCHVGTDMEIYAAYHHLKKYVVVYSGDTGNLESSRWILESCNVICSNLEDAIDNIIALHLRNLD